MIVPAPRRSRPGTVPRIGDQFAINPMAWGRIVNSVVSVSSAAEVFPLPPDGEDSTMICPPPLKEGLPRKSRFTDLVFVL